VKGRCHEGKSVTGQRSNQLNYVPNLFSYLYRKPASLVAFLRFNRFACVACFNHWVPHSVDFGTGSTNKLRGTKQRVFSTAAGGWNRGFWHTRLERGQNPFWASFHLPFCQSRGE